jgi:hypothetical protein
VLDPQYVVARTVLLDVLEALGDQRGAVVVVGAAAPRQDGRTAGQARPLLLAPAGRESSDTAAVRGDAPADLAAAHADRLMATAAGDCLGEERGATRKRCPRKMGVRVFIGRNSGRRGGS